MNNSIKLLAFTIAIKRYKSNSVLMDTARYKMSSKFGISTQTFNKYLVEAQKIGWINISGGNFVVKKLNDIIIDFNNQTGLFFSNHKVLENRKKHSFKDVLKEIEQILLIDNIIAPQQFEINKKSKFVNDYNILISPTGKKRGKVTQSQKKMMRMGLRSAEKEISGMNYTDRVMTSARHTSSVMGMSVSKANKVLNLGGKVNRSILQVWIHGISFVKIEELKIQYPKAKIIPYVHYNKIKVCFGSEIKLG